MKTVSMWLKLCQLLLFAHISQAQKREADPPHTLYNLRNEINKEIYVDSISNENSYMFLPYKIEEVDPYLFMFSHISISSILIGVFIMLLSIVLLYLSAMSFFSTVVAEASVIDREFPTVAPCKSKIAFNILKKQTEKQVKALD